MRNFICFFALFAFLFACSSGSKKPNTTNNATEIEKITVLSPSSASVYKNTDTLTFSFQINDSVAYDSISVKIDGSFIKKLSKPENQFKWALAESKVGNRPIEVSLLKKGKSIASQMFTIQVKSGIAPKYYTYKVLKTYNHDANSYTQGLVFDNGNLYEGSGLYGNSTIRQVDLQTGKVLKSQDLSEKIFGEGVTVFGDKLYQLSWRENIAFVYDKKTFQNIGTFNYPTEGWGLTTDGENLIMSDGSSNLYYLNPENFKLIKQVEVYDNHGPVRELNELEYIDGEVWANVYTTDTIVRINPGNGVVVGKIDFTGILSPTLRTAETDVLNGIAFNKLTKELIVTGKKWPKIFRISISPK